MKRALLFVLLLVCASEHSAGAATAAQDGDGLRHWLGRIGVEVEQLIATRRIVPPTPVKLRWRARRIWSGVLSGDTLDLATADLAADGQDELFLLTGGSLTVLSRRRGLFDVRSQVDLAGRPAQLRSRDAIGMLAIGAEPSSEIVLRTRTSEQAMGASFVWRDGALQKSSEFVGYPFCDSATLNSAPGQNYFLGESVTWPSGVGTVLASSLYSVRCTHGMVDPLGKAVRYLSQVSLAGELTLQCLGEEEGCAPGTRNFPSVGYAHLVVDLTNDGRPEVVTSSAEARGGADRIQVFSYDGAAPKLVFERDFARGIVALTAGDFDGDGALELVAAERGTSPGKVSLWLLN